jgi:hypothetical protein
MSFKVPNLKVEEDRLVRGNCQLTLTTEPNSLKAQSQRLTVHCLSLNIVVAIIPGKEVLKVGLRVADGSNLIIFVDKISRDV